MKQFTYTITDALGIHARPAGMLAKLARSYGSDTTAFLTKGEETVKLSQLMLLMGLGVKKDEEVTVTVEGPAEEEACAALEAFFKESL